MAKVICPCFNISDAQLVAAVHEGGISDVEQFVEKTGAGAACGQCKIDLERILEKEVGYQRETEEPNV